MRSGAWKVGLASDLRWAELIKGRGETGVLGRCWKGAWPARSDLGVIERQGLNESGAKVDVITAGSPGAELMEGAGLTLRGAWSPGLAAGPEAAPASPSRRGGGCPATPRGRTEPSVPRAGRPPHTAALPTVEREQL